MSPCLGLTLPILSLLPYCCGVIFLSHKSDYVLQSPSENPLGTPDSHRIKWALKHGVQRCGQKLPRLLPSPLWTSYFCSELPYPCWTTLAIFLRVPASFVPPYIWMHYPEDRSPVWKSGQTTPSRWSPVEEDEKRNYKLPLEPQAVFYIFPLRVFPTS